MINYLLFGVFVALQCGDFYTTYKIIKTGKGYEANPLVAKAIKELGLEVGLGFVKVFCIVIGFFLMPYWHALAVLNALYLWVVFNNYKVLTK
jgi:hypothetical protein